MATQLIHAISLSSFAKSQWSTLTKQPQSLSHPETSLSACIYATSKFLDYDLQFSLIKTVATGNISSHILYFFILSEQFLESLPLLHAFLPSTPPKSGITLETHQLIQS